MATYSTSASATPLMTFALVDAKTNQIVSGYENLGANNTVNLGDLDLAKYSVIAQINSEHPDADQVESVRFASDLGNRTENVVPYALFGDINSNFRGKAPAPGAVSLKATAYTQDGGKGDAIGTATLDYTLVDTAAPAPKAGITAAFNDITARKMGGTAGDDTLSIRTHTGIGTRTKAGAGSDTVILYGSEEIPTGNYHQMLADLKAKPGKTAKSYFGSTHKINLGADTSADSLSLISEIDALPKFMLKHTEDDGRIDGGGVAGENGAAYDHWSGVFGYVDIANFDPSRDSLKLAGHTTTLGESFTKGSHFFQTVYSEQNANDQSGPRAGAAHDDTFLGLIRFAKGAAMADEIADAITVDGMRTFVVKGLGEDVYEGDPTDNQVGDTITDEKLFNFALINSETDEIVEGYENLSDGVEIDLNGLNLEKFSIVAQVNPDHFYAGEVESVRFDSNRGNQTENVVPYALFGDREGDYRGQAIEPGEVSLKATAYSKNGGKGQAIGSVDLSYSIVDSGAGQESAMTASESLELVPTSGSNATVQAGTGQGLNAVYYSDRNLDTPALNRVDSSVDFFWGSGSPDASLGSDQFSARWSGYVMPQYSETYEFNTSSDDGVRLWVDETLLVDNWTNHAETVDQGSIELKAGELYPITMEYFENQGQAVAQLSWASDSQALEVIPQGQLFTASQVEAAAV